MAKGDGEDSYSKNCRVQTEETTKYVQPELEKALEKLSLPADGRVVMADLGCSSGPNAIRSLAFIADKLRAKFAASSLPSPEFEAFFNDLPSNDFNSLFQLLSSDPINCSAKDSFAAGLPGSFYGRLFPRSSVNVFFSEHCVHWMSEVPVIMGTHAEKMLAFPKQAAADLKVFLEARAAELVSGGLLFLWFCGRNNMVGNDRTAVDMVKSMTQVWSDLISQGVVTQEQRDEFSVPFYARTSEEVKEAVESRASEFEVLTLNLFETSVKWFEDSSSPKPAAVATRIVGTSRGVLGTLVETHFGRNAADIFWRQLQNQVTKEYLLSKDLPSNYNSRRHCVVLIRK